MRLLVPLSLLLATPLPAAPKPAPQPAPIRLSVDARDAPRKRLHAQISMAAAPGTLTLVYPKWIPGEHGPSGPIVNLAGIVMRSGGQPVAWRRDPADMFAFVVDMPAGSPTLEVDLEFLIPAGGAFTAGRSASEQLAVLSWNTVLLYPAGRSSDAVTFEPRLRLPEGWSHASALPESARAGGEIAFGSVPLTRLVDSPVLMGAHLAAVRLEADGPAHELSVAADSAAALELKPAAKAGLEKLIGEAKALFGAQHFQSYRWLLALSDHVEWFGLEHHESSDNRMGERTLAGDPGRRGLAGLLAHEYVHSWNGKFRRPADIFTTDYQRPMRTNLLWVYEGLTQYLGALLPARSGLWTAEEYRENLASLAARLDQQAGREWRPLVDTAVSAQVLFGASDEGSSLRRDVAFYDESVLIWLEADMRIRQASGEKLSLDDFCRRFHGGPEGPYVVKQYGLDEVLTTLQGLATHDWRGFFAERVDRVAPRAPLGGLAAAGWKLAFSEEPNVFRKDREERDKVVDESASIGVWVREDGRFKDVVPGLAAARAGLTAGMKLVAVNGRRYTPEVLRDALKATRNGGALELLVDNEDFFRSVKLAYDGGLRYPHLVRDEAKPDLLAKLIAPLAP